MKLKKLDVELTWENGTEKMNVEILWKVKARLESYKERKN